MASLPTSPEAITLAAGEAAADRPWLDLLVIFGSAASGRLRGDSDVDLGWVGWPLGPEDESLLREALERRLGREAHLVDLRHASDLLRVEVVRSGRLALERTPGAWTTFTAEALSRWFDIEPLVTRCAEAVRARAIAAGAVQDG